MVMCVCRPRRISPAATTRHHLEPPSLGHACMLAHASIPASSPPKLSSCIGEGKGKGGDGRNGRHPAVPNGSSGVKPLSVARPKRARVSNTDLALSIGRPIFVMVLRANRGPMDVHL